MLYVCDCSIQVKVFVEGLFHLDKDIPQFKEHLRDFLVQIKVILQQMCFHSNLISILMCWEEGRNRKLQNLMKYLKLAVLPLSEVNKYYMPADRWGLIIKSSRVPLSNHFRFVIGGDPCMYCEVLVAQS